MSCVCIIPARGGSTRIPGKNKKLFHGKPIISYSIENAKKSKVFDRILVSTDDVEIEQISLFYGVDVLQRPEYMARNEVGTQDVMRNVLEQLELTMKIEYACCLYPTAPLLSHETISQAYKMAQDDMSGYVVPVGTWLRDPGQFYFGHASLFKYGVPLNTHGTRIIYIGAETDCDINVPDDWTRAEKMYEQLMEKA